VRKKLLNKARRHVGSAVGHAALSLMLVSAPVAPVLAAASGWSGATAISPVGQPDPTRGSQLNDVAVNAGGLTIAAWDQYTYNNGGGASIGAAVQSGGRWAAPFTISDIQGMPSTGGFSMSPRVAVGADGTMAVSWTYQEPVSDPVNYPNPVQKIRVAMRPAGATTWTISDLDQGSIGGVAITQFVPVAVDDNGNVTAVWSLWDGTTNKHLVKAATLPKGRTWSAPVNLAADVDGIFPSLAINSRGDAAVAFVISAWAYNSTGTNAQYVYRNGPTAAWGAPEVVSESLSSTVGYITNPVVALDNNGLATVAYFGDGVEAVRETLTGWTTAPHTVLKAQNSSVSSYGSIDLGIDGAGNAVLAASIFDATINVDRSSVFVALGAPDGTWSAQQQLTDPTVPVDAYATRVAVSPNGSLALVGWIDHYHGVAQVSKLTGSLWGKATTIGKSTAFSAFQEVLSLDAASDSTVVGPAKARAIWKSAKSGTQIYAAGYSQ